MKTYKLISFVFICCLFTATSFAQTTKTETIKVSGECGMCKTKIEKAAKAAGASYADWNVDTKVLTVKYSSKSTNPAKIQKSVAETGYDTQDVKTTEEAYNKLHECCKYERASADKAKMDCCKDGKCTMEGHDGKDCCKAGADGKMECCKDGKCTMEGHDGKDCCKMSGDAKMDCCKDGKCTKEGHNGKDCCKKS